MSMIDYALIRLVHRVDAMLSSTETYRRIHEVQRCPYPGNARCAALAKVCGKKGGMSQTELDTLREFPEHGINVGNVSNGLLFADALCRMPVNQHKAIVSLMRQGKLGIVEGYNVDSEKRERMEQIIVRVGS